MRKIMRELTLKWRKPSRYFLERKLIPRIKNKKILFVGCAPYTANYPQKFKGNDLWTIDIDPNMEKYGAHKHIIDSIENINHHFEPETFDVIFLLGIIGYGINTEKSANNALEQLHTVLKTKGRLIIENKNTPDHNTLKTSQLKHYQHYKEIPLLGRKTPFTTQNIHTWYHLSK